MDKATQTEDVPSNVVSALRSFESAPPAVPTRRIWPWLLLIVLTAASVSAWLFWKHTPSTGTITVATMRLTPEGRSAIGGQSEAIEVSGYVVSPQIATVSSNRTGRLVELNVAVGDIVREGFLIARLDNRQTQILLQQDRARLDHQKRLLVLRNDQKILADQQLKRANELLERETVSRQTYDEAKRVALTSAEQLLLVEQNIAELENSIALSERILDDHIIRAPFDGIVTNLSANLGEIVSPASGGGTFTRSGVCTIIGLEQQEIHFDVNERYLGALAMSDHITAELASIPDTTIELRLKRIAPIANNQTGTITVVTEPIAAPERLKTGASAVARFERRPPDLSAADPDAAVILPSNALHQMDNRTIVYLARDGRAVPLEVNAIPFGAGTHRLVSPVNITDGIIVWSEATLRPMGAIKEE